MGRHYRPICKYINTFFLLKQMGRHCRPLLFSTCFLFLTYLYLRLINYLSNIKKNKFDLNML